MPMLTHARVRAYSCLRPCLPMSASALTHACVRARRILRGKPVYFLPYLLNFLYFCPPNHRQTLINLFQ